MKKLLLIILLTFTTIASANEDRFTIFKDDTEGVWIFDNMAGEIKYCSTNILKDGEIVAACTGWSAENTLTMQK